MLLAVRLSRAGVLEPAGHQDVHESDRLESQQDPEDGEGCSCMGANKAYIKACKQADRNASRSCKEKSQRHLQLECLVEVLPKKQPHEDAQSYNDHRNDLVLRIWLVREVHDVICHAMSPP